MTSCYLNEQKTKIQFQLRMDIGGEYLPNVGDFIIHYKTTFKVYSKIYDNDTGLILLNAEKTE